LARKSTTGIVDLRLIKGGERPKVPADLGEAGQRLWSVVTGAHAAGYFKPADLTLLLRACELEDRVSPKLTLKELTEIARTQATLLAKIRATNSTTRDRDNAGAQKPVAARSWLGESG
jgi:hypothetical protein